MVPTPMRLTRAGNRLAASWPILLLIAMLALGLAAYFLEWGQWQALLQWARGHAQQGWLVAALILLQVVLFMFALPGTSLLWVVATLYPPVESTLILVAGATGGATAAYFFARIISTSRLTQLQSHRAFRLLREHGNFFALCVLRLIPGFPHSVINYGAGVLRLPVGQFISASVLGIAVKSYLYSNVIHAALTASEPADLLQADIVAPLIVLALLLLLAGFIQRRVQASGD